MLADRPTFNKFDTLMLQNSNFAFSLVSGVYAFLVAVYLLA